ncbi:MAG: hypothetical protein ACYTGZ_19105 [Planctomycetota bacterium]
MWIIWLRRLLVTAAVVIAGAALWAGVPLGGVVMLGLVVAGVISWGRVLNYWPTDSDDEQS